MLDFLRVQIYIMGFISILAGLVLAYISLDETEAMTSACYDECDKPIKITRITTFFLIAFYWLIATGQKTQECFARYGDLSKTCGLLGRLWIIYGGLIILVSIIGGFLHINKDMSSSLAKLRNTGLWTGFWHLLLSILFKVV